MADVKDWTAYCNSAYSETQVSAWLKRRNLPAAYVQYIEAHTKIPMTAESLFTLFRCQITTFPYENLTLHYSKDHVISIRPGDIYTKLMNVPENGRGGYCMEVSIFFHHMLSRIGFHTYMTGVRNRTRMESGVPQGEYQGWSHINNIVHLPDGSRYSLDVGFGGSGPISPLRMDDTAEAITNLGTQEIRLVHDNIDKQNWRGSKLWIYQYRNDASAEWNSFYSFSEVEFFQEDFEVLNWWSSAKTFHRWTPLAVRFLREGEPVELDQDDAWTAEDTQELKSVAKVVLVGDVVKLSTGGRTRVVHRCESEEERRQALGKYIGIHLTEEEFRSIHGYGTALPGGNER